MSNNETTSWGTTTNNEANSWGFTPVETQDSRPGRFNQMLHNPNAQARARQIAENVGGGALNGALEKAGLVNKDGTLRKRGVVKAVLRPTHTARQAATGAVHGARKAGMQEARSYADAAQQQITEVVGTHTQQVVEGGKKKLFGRSKAQQPQVGIAPVALSANDDPFSRPFTGAQEANPWGLPKTANEDPFSQPTGGAREANPWGLPQPNGNYGSTYPGSTVPDHNNTTAYPSQTSPWEVNSGTASTDPFASAESWPTASGHNSAPQTPAYGSAGTPEPTQRPW